LGRVGVEILQSDAKTSLQIQTRCGYLPQKLWMILDPVIEPIVSDWNPIRTPAGRPCRVMTISSLAASRRYFFDKSSLTFASATSRIRGSFLVEPLLRVPFSDDGEDFDCCFFDVIKHPYFIDSQDTAADSARVIS
jgi:hypothetical protein